MIKLMGKEYRGCIFDLDGTLLNTLEDITDSMNSVLEKRNFPLRTTEEIKVFVGDGLRTLVLKSLPESIRYDFEEECLLEMREAYALKYREKTHKYEGIDKLIEYLMKNMIKMGVLSNKADDFTKKITEHYFGSGLFSSIIGETEGMPRKPAPDGALKIAKEFSIKPAEMIYIGDTNADMFTAINSGMFPIGAGWGFRGEDELRESGARVILKNPTQLITMMSQ